IFRDDNGGRDLSKYDALTFWAKASKAATINDIGFGQDFGQNKFQVSKRGLRLTTNWVKYTIPIPDASKLKQEKGMFWYAEGPENGDGYSFWIDELQFEKLGTIAQPRPSILNGDNISVNTFIGVNINVADLNQTFNLGTGEDISISSAPGYFIFSSSNPSVASVSETGVVEV
ncbi:MAG: glycosyl hydrolase family 16, partial [Polaribacter sp.]|nr:glycosyl hydrolase family 16 [Polaribacter sp.]